jgi:hypothetical protein
MEYVLHHLVATSWIGFTALPSYCFDTSLAIACVDELTKFTMEQHTDIVPNVSGESVKANPVMSSNKWSTHRVPDWTEIVPVHSVPVRPVH